MPELKESALGDLLDRHLGQVAAPEELWSRIQNGSRPRRASMRVRPVSRRLAWTMAAAMMVGGAAWMLHPRPNAELRSNSATEIREWVKERTELNVPLRESAPVQLLGAHLTNHGAAAEIAYRAGDHDGTLAVARTTEGADTHLSAVNEARARLVSWTMRGQSFTVACDDPDAARAACLLCHS